MQSGKRIRKTDELWVSPAPSDHTTSQRVGLPGRGMKERNDSPASQHPA